MPPQIEENKILPILRELKGVLTTIEGRALFVSGDWGGKKHEYTKFIQDWPVKEVGFHREKAPGFWKIIGPLLGYNFVLELEDPAFLVNVFQLFNGNRSIAFWSVGNAEAADFKVELLAQSLVPGGSNTRLWGDLMRFAPNLFWLAYLEDIGDEEPYLWLHCGEKVPPAIKQIISNNNLEPYAEGAADP